MGRTSFIRPRFTTPADNRRPHGAHRYEVWSPKLSRRITFFHDLRLDAWVLLEAEPAVTAFCERPLVFKGEKRNRVVDFWVRRGGSEELLILGPGDSQDQAPSAHPALSAFAEAEKMNIRILSSTDVRANPHLLSNWKTILHYLAPNVRLLSNELKERTLEECAASDGRTLVELEEALTDEDPVLVRTAVFALLHEGNLTSPDVASAPLGGATRFTVVS